MTRSIVRSTSTVLMAVLNSEYASEGAELQTLAERLQRLMESDQQMRGSILYRPNHLGQKRFDEGGFRAHVSEQLEILSRLGLVESDEGRWKLPVRGLSPLVEDLRRDEAGPRMNDGALLEGGIAEVLAHPTLFCLPKSEFQQLVAAAVGAAQ